MSGWRFETPRLLIRPTTVDDAEAVFAARSAMPFDPPRRDLAATRRMIEDMARMEPGAESGWAQFAIVEQARVVGDIGVHFGHPAPRQAEIGFALVADARGRGIATDAVGCLADHLLGDHGLHRLTALTDIRNVATQRLLERLRFRVEGRFVASWAEGDDWYDELAFARLASE